MTNINNNQKTFTGMYQKIEILNIKIDQKSLNSTFVKNENLQIFPKIEQNFKKTQTINFYIENNENFTKKHEQKNIFQTNDNFDKNKIIKNNFDQKNLD